MNQLRPLLAAALTAAAVSMMAGAAQTGYPVKRMDFDLWCTEEMRWPFERCAQRLADDLQKFDDYRAIIEKYEIRQQQEKQRRLQLEHSVLNNDPVDRPIGSNPTTAAPLTAE